MTETKKIEKLIVQTVAQIVVDTLEFGHVVPPGDQDVAWMKSSVVDDRRSSAMRAQWQAT